MNMIYAKPASPNKALVLFDLATRILNDECPPGRSNYLCLSAEEYADGICEQCWIRCLEAACFGRQNKEAHHE